MQLPNIQEIERVISHALAEDLGQGDVTSEALISDTQQGKASIISRARGIIAGTEIAKRVFLKVDASLNIRILIEDADHVNRDHLIAEIHGKYASILKAERVALNFLQHLSGIASATARYIEAVKDLPTQITDTRKTTPGLRALEKYAVQAGGGRNHRMHLGDGILIKDNHLAILREQGLSTAQVVSRARRKAANTLTIEIEVSTPQEASEAAAAGADIIMLDNMTLQDMRQAVKLVNRRALTEASGGISLDRVRATAETGVDFISIGALTHSAKALDISLEIDSNFASDRKTG